MPAITILDLNNAKLDANHIAAIATSTQATATDRLGHTKPTIAGAVATIDQRLVRVESAESTAIGGMSASVAEVTAAKTAAVATAIPGMVAVVDVAKVDATNAIAAKIATVDAAKNAAANTAIPAIVAQVEGVKATATGTTIPTIVAQVEAAKLSAISTAIPAILAGIPDRGVAGYGTLALLNADLNRPDKFIAYVTNDPSPENNTTYRKDGVAGAGSWIPSSATPVSLLATEVAALIKGTDSPRGGLVIVDEYGFAGFSIDGDTIGFSGMEATYVEGSEGLILIDEHGFSRNIVSDGRDETAPAAGVTDAYVGARDARALALSAERSPQKNAHCAGLIRGVNHVIVYGQSLSLAAQGWPALSVAPPLGSLLMVGDSSRAATTGSTTTFVPFGGVLTLKPLVATMTLGTSMVTEAELDGVIEPRGEDPGIAAVTMLKQAWNRMHGYVDDPDRKIVLTAVGQGDRTIAELSKGAAPNIYNRIPDAASKVRDLAAANNEPYQLLAVLYLQGEADYSANTDEATFVAAVRKLRNDIHADVSVAIAGQSNPEMFVAVQAGAQFTSDQKKLAVANGHIALAAQEPCWALATPYYYTTDRSGHLSPNGYRQIGCQLGKALAESVVHRRRSASLTPLSVTHSGAEVLITFDVPCPPLRWGTPYVDYTAVDYPQKGFSARDSQGNIALVPTMAGAASVKLALVRPPVGSLEIWCGDSAIHGGSTCLRDSDGTIAPFNYEFNPKDKPGANISALVGRPYDLSNWAMAWVRTSTNIES